MSRKCGCQTNNAQIKECGSEEHEHGHEENRKRAYISLGLSLIFLLLTFATPDITLKYSFAMLSALLSGALLYINGIKSLFKLKLDETTLLFIAVVAAFFIGEYFEAAIVAFLFRLGELIEDVAVNRSQKSIEAVLDIRPDSAFIKNENGEIERVKAEDIHIGDKIIVKPGDRLALDAVVEEGSSQIDGSALTGESVPVDVSVGDTILSGSLNTSGVLVCRVIRDFQNSTASQIIEMVKDSAAKKSKTEKFITRFAQLYTPIVVVAAVLLASLPPLLGFGEFSMWLYRALIFLVASCPCALVISVPMSYFSAIGICSKAGVLVKGGRFIEMLANIDSIAFDKTGTLTTGNLKIDKIHTTKDITEEELLEIAIACEMGSNHPLANAITQAGKTDKTIQDSKEYAGKGISGIVDGKNVLCGSKTLLSENDIAYDHLPNAQVYIAMDGIAVGAITLTDTVKGEAKSSIDQFKEMGITDITILSGDHKQEVKKVAQACGIDQYYSELLPQDKANMFESLKKDKKTVAFVGDGINDAPVLALADVGIAVATGTDAAAQAADVVLMSDNLTALAKSITLSKNAISIVKQNIIFALSIKAIVLLLGALGYADMAAAVFADVGVTIISVLNAMRILSKK